MRSPSIMLVVGSLVGSVTISALKAQEAVRVEQGWTSAQRANWYQLSQGSRLIPYDWLFALEQPDSTRPFLDRAHVEKFRYLSAADAGTGQSLPVGFVVDRQSDAALLRTNLRWKESQSDREPWVGMNCAACHTAELTYQGKRLRIEGGPTLADFQGFVETLNKSLTATQAMTPNGSGSQPRFSAATTTRAIGFFLRQRSTN